MPSWRLHSPQRLVYLTKLNEILARANQHRQNGAILEHMSTHHHITIVSFDELSPNVKILKVIPDFHKLTIYEALMILHKKNGS